MVNLTEPDVEIQIDGAGKWALADSKTARLELPPGEHKLTVKRGAEELYSAPFTVKRGARGRARREVDAEEVSRTASAWSSFWCRGARR